MSKTSILYPLYLAFISFKTMPTKDLHYFAHKPIMNSFNTNYFSKDFMFTG